MRVLVLGATGLIGSAVAARLAAAGHEVVGITKSRASRRRGLAGITWVQLDIAQAVTPTAWARALEGVDAVVNSAGVLQDSNRDDSSGVHVVGPKALYEACAERGIKRVILISALGVEDNAPTDFSRNKRAGEQLLEETSLHWVILRPSVVVAPAAYGASALIRSLAALPIRPKVAGAEPVAAMQVSELANTVLFFLQNKSPKRVALDLEGPDRQTVDEIISTYRQWLGWRRAWLIPVPNLFTALTCRIGDAISVFGWRTPMRTTSIRELSYARDADTTEWKQLTGIQPQSLSDALSATPPSVQERWFAKLYILKALIFATLFVYWVASGVIALGPGWESALQQLKDAGTGEHAHALLLATAAADIVIGIGIAFYKTAKAALIAAAGLTLAYLGGGTYLEPDLWADPLGPLLKIVPIFVLILTAYAIVDDR